MHMCVFVSSVYSRIQSSISYMVKADRRIIVVSCFSAFWGNKTSEEKLLG